MSIFKKFLATAQSEGAAAASKKEPYRIHTNPCSDLPVIWEATTKGRKVMTIKESKLGERRIYYVIFHDLHMSLLCDVFTVSDASKLDFNERPPLFAAEDFFNTMRNHGFPYQDCHVPIAKNAIYKGFERLAVSWAQNIGITDAVEFYGDKESHAYRLFLNIEKVEPHYLDYGKYPVTI